jgi:hypothetical protein
LSTQQIQYGQGRSRSPSIYLLAKHLGAADEDWYPGVPPRMDSEGPRRGLLRLGPLFKRFQRTMACPQGVENYIYKIYVK